ncbi:MAG: hypothetical protein WCF67_09625 [Chitinophagaceae bacterium]
MAYTPIRSFDNYLYANILLSRVKDEGYDCYLKDENTVTIDPLLSPAIGGMKLMVLEEDAPTIITLLETLEAEYLATVPCPNCRQHAIQLIKKTRTSGSFLGALFSQLINGSTQSEQRLYRCSHCGLKLDDLPIFAGD